RARIKREAVAHRRGGRLVLGHHAIEGGRFGDARAQIEADRREQKAEDEGHAPPPGQHRLLIEERVEEIGRQGAHDEAEPDAELLHRADEAALAGRRILHEKGRGPSPFAAGREALHKAAEHEKDRRPDADRRIGWDEAGDCGCRRHQAYRQHERHLEPLQIAERADDDGADRAHEEADAEGREATQQGRQGIIAREEIGADLRREEAVDHEIEKLDEIADRARDDRAPPKLFAYPRRRTSYRDRPWLATWLPLEFPSTPELFTAPFRARVSPFGEAETITPPFRLAPTLSFHQAPPAAACR